MEEIVLKDPRARLRSVGAQNLLYFDTGKSIAAENNLKEPNPQSEDLVNWNKKCAKQ